MKVYRIADDKYIIPIRSHIHGVNHRGYHTAPENTLPAYRLSALMGFRYVECDVSFTSDNVPVLLHDETIDRTSNGSGIITQMTFNEVRQYDFGAWKGAEYVGTKIPSLEEFLVVCRNLGLNPYIEIKSTANYTDDQIQMIVNMVKGYGLSKCATFISFSSGFLTKVKNYDETARIGFVVSGVTEQKVEVARTLMTDKNEVFFTSSYTAVPIAEQVAICKEAKIPLELWTIDNLPTIVNMDDYVSGITSNKHNAEFVKFEKSLK